MSRGWGQGRGRGNCTLRSKASWVMVTWKSPPSWTTWHTWVKTLLPAHNFVGSVVGSRIFQRGGARPREGCTNVLFIRIFAKPAWKRKLKQWGAGLFGQPITLAPRLLFNLAPPHGEILNSLLYIILEWLRKIVLHYSLQLGLGFAGNHLQKKPILCIKSTVMQHGLNFFTKK